MAVLFITHDMAVVAQMADRVVVMYRGDSGGGGAGRRAFSTAPQRRIHARLAGRRAETRRHARQGRHRNRMRIVGAEPIGASFRVVTAASCGKAARGRATSPPASPSPAASFAARWPRFMPSRTSASRFAKRGNPVAGRRVRLRQIVLRPFDTAPRGGGIGRPSSSTAGTSASSRPARPPPRPPRHADDLSGPVRVAEPIPPPQRRKSPNRCRISGSHPRSETARPRRRPCSIASELPRRLPAPVSRTNCRAGSGSASPSRGRWRRTRS